VTPGRARGVFRLVDPRISLASMASMLLGAAMAARGGSLAWGWLAVTIGGLAALEAAKNASGEVFDFDSGTDLAVADEDRSPFSGGKRVLVDGLLTRRQTWAVAGTGYAVGIAAGLAIAAWRTPMVLWIGLVGVACAWCYHAPPLKLAYRGLGEAAVAACYGPLIACGTFAVQRGRVEAPVAIAAAPLGALIAGFLLINELPDARADRLAGKRTLAVRLGRRRAARALSAVVVLAFAGVLALPLAGLPIGAWGGLAGLPPGLAAARRAWAGWGNTPRLVPAQGWMLLSFLLCAVGMAAGLLLS
jgi:1,4-dihydroxy-2-naphthoate polyprenyltransferase